jgi:uncharacterized protein with HEPN domain
MHERLSDILRAADELQGFLLGVNVVQFCKDGLRQRASEQLVALIGEAAKQLPDEVRDGLEQPWPRIIGFAAFGSPTSEVEKAQLYRAATETVPALAEAIQAYT